MEARYLKAILDSMEMAVVFVDTGHIVRFVNSAGEKKINDGLAAIGRSIFSAFDDNCTSIIRDKYEDIEGGRDIVPLFDYRGHSLKMKAVHNRKNKLEGYLVLFDNREE